MLPLPASMGLQSQRALERFSPPLTEADQQLRAVLGFSDFVAESLQQNPQWVRSLREHPPQAEEEHNYAQWLADVLAGAGQEADIRQYLRQFRRHMLVRIAWLQILNQATTRQTLRQLSSLAEVLIVAARDWCWQQCCQELGTPTDPQGEAQPLLILGMGKLGGRELNFSSDIDLIFAWPENGTTYGGRRELDNAQFFTCMGQRLIKLLDQPDSNGFVYRVDMRLRPFGDSGPLVMSFSALEDYYQQHGRDWERYAMVKGRVMGADSHLSFSHQLHQMLRPFIYRRYIDFSVIPSLRSMKAKITHEVRRRGLSNNIKLGTGGIRECEFIVQVFQLIRGGRERALQQQSLLYALDEVANLGLLEPQYAETLRSAYLYLRRLENLLQSINDQQTQTLPEDPLNQQRLAWAMGENDWGSLRQRTDQHMQSVRKIFDELIGEQDPQPTVTRHQAWQQVWSEQAEAEDLAEVAPGLPEPIQHRLIRDIREFHREFNRRALGPRGRQALDRLMPDLLAGACLYNNADQVLQRLCPVLSSVFTRSTYLELLTEYPQALKQLIRLCAASSMVATRLARYPMLLDELLDPATLYQPTALNNYRDELRQYLLRVPAKDEEQQLEALRQFKLTQQLRIAAADIAGTLPLMKVSDHLTWLAEAILEAVVRQAWAQVIQRFGQPDHLRNETCQGFAVVAYGKLGGWELGYGSDLDLVFLHDCPAQSMTTGERMIDGRQFYLKLAQRILHLFSTRTASGILYEVDARLRPSGSSGMLVSTFSAFEQYQREEAWTWEHQALVRARIVYASSPLQQEFEQIRQRILCLPRHPQQLQTDVREMRKKMLKQPGNRHLPDWDIKADSGGITDIEFIAQYLVLRFAAKQSALTRWTGNIRIFELLARYQIMSATQAGALSQAYIRLREQLHHLALQEASRGVAQDQFSGERALILSSWQQWLLDPATAVD